MRFYFFFFYLEILFAVAKRIYYTIVIRLIENIYKNLLNDDIKYPKKNFN